MLSKQHGLKNPVKEVEVTFMGPPEQRTESLKTELFHKQEYCFVSIQANFEPRSSSGMRFFFPSRV